MARCIIVVFALGKRMEQGDMGRRGPRKGGDSGGEGADGLESEMRYENV
jgi:hypothetical protein